MVKKEERGAAVLWGLLLLVGHSPIFLDRPFTPGYVDETVQKIASVKFLNARLLSKP